MENGIRAKQDSGTSTDSPCLMYPSLAFSHSRYGLVYLARKKGNSINHFASKHPGAKEAIK